MFEDRRDAGERLARALKRYKDKKVIVLAIPMGGVEVGYHVAKYLNAEFSVLIARKLAYPDEPEAGFGAIAEDGSSFIFDEAYVLFSEETIDKIKREQIQEIKRRIEVLRDGKPLPEIKDKTAILVDDGLAMGSTMTTAVMLCRNKKAEKVVVAVPVAGRDVAARMEKLADEVVILEKPAFFRAVAQVYNNWYDVSDDEVVDIINRWKKAH